jgi:hypothetical protein
MDNLFRFLIDVAANPKQQLAFANETDAVMVAAKLTKVEQAVVSSKSSSRLAEMFTDELTQLAAICGDPGPDPTPDPDDIPPDDTPPNPPTPSSPALK